MKAIFGGVVAIVLLGIYLHLIGVGYRVISCDNTPGCTDYPREYFNDGMAQALAIVSGLVSALVIAELAVTKPGEPPAMRGMSAGVGMVPKQILRIVAAAYVLVWIVAGLFAFGLGLYYPTVLPPITSLGQAWLGLAVATAYAYFGIDPR